MTHMTHDTCELSFFRKIMKKSCKRFVNRNENVVTLQRNLNEKRKVKNEKIQDTLFR